MLYSLQFHLHAGLFKLKKKRHFFYKKSLISIYFNTAHCVYNSAHIASDIGMLLAYSQILNGVRVTTTFILQTIHLFSF